MEYQELLNACRGVYVKYNTRIGRQWTDYFDIYSQLKRIENLSKCYSRKYEEFNKKYMGHPNPKENIIADDDLLPLDSMVIDIVISYAKCFDTSKNKEGKESRRLIRLNRHFLRNIDKSALKLHDELIDFRDKFVAHAGVSVFENFEYRIGLDEKGTTGIIHGDNYRAIRNPLTKFENMEVLLTEVLKEVNTKREALLEKVQEELDAISSRPEFFLNKLRSGQPIVDNDLK